jgi:hypothetical protein
LQLEYITNTIFKERKVENEKYKEWEKVKNRVAKIVPCFLLPVYVFAQGSWQWQNPLPQGADMFAVFTLSPNRAIITGSGGTIMTTEDTGKSWRIQRLPQVDCGAQI